MQSENDLHMTWCVCVGGVRIKENKRPLLTRKQNIMLAYEQLHLLTGYIWKTYIYLYTWIHTYTPIYIYIYIYRERERETDRQTDRE